MTAVKLFLSDNTPPFYLSSFQHAKSPTEKGRAFRMC